jgi:hypothetical protein
MHLRHVPPCESHGKENCTRPGPVAWLVGPFYREGCPQQKKKLFTGTILELDQLYNLKIREVVIRK